MSRRGVVQALLSAVLFGLSAPLAKALLQDVPPVMLAGLLYLGSGIGLGIVRALSGGQNEAPVAGADRGWLAAAVVCGGIVAPVLLMDGLQFTAGSTASLLLNLEGAFTALLAWRVFRENADTRIVLGMACVLVAGLFLAWPSQGQPVWSSGALLVAGACLFWAIDNNLTGRVSGADPLTIVMAKGLAAGAFNLVLSLALGAHLPGLAAVCEVMLLGLLSYGVSLLLYVRALRHLGTARTSAYFGLAPFVGALVAFPLLHESASALFVPSLALMAVGVWLHLSERHAHEHAHPLLSHAHLHSHDEHHQHEHEGLLTEPHSHPHVHQPLVHVHPHYPDLHHRHHP
ncbi:MAG TPA: DMT family transporter [Candidatus Xenobia bacterium]|jgi:drug/metabolite transporter (DMT)-like permease